jgi:hypothetical protein
MNCQENLARRAIKKESRKWWRASGVYGPRMSISEIESWELAINNWEHFATETRASGIYQQYTAKIQLYEHPFFGIYLFIYSIQIDSIQETTTSEMHQRDISEREDYNNIIKKWQGQWWRRMCRIAAASDIIIRFISGSGGITTDRNPHQWRTRCGIVGFWVFPNVHKTEKANLERCDAKKNISSVDSNC